MFTHFPEGCVMDDSKTPTEALLLRGAERLKGHQRRLFMAEVTLELCGGSARRAERCFGWGRGTVAKGLHELRQGIRCLENFSARGRSRWEEQHAQLADDIRELVEPHTQADPELKSPRRYTNWSAAEVLEALQTQKGYVSAELPRERTMRDILNRMGYRLKRIQKGKPLKKTAQTDTIFANVKAVRAEVRNDPSTLEISVDTKAKVKEGDYARGGKNSDRVGREDGPRVGS
jgi:transposase